MSNMQVDTVKLKNDTALRKRLMDHASFEHPAKCPLTLVQAIADRYGLKAGDVVLDPMAGSGSTMILALQGINVILVELEQHFAEPMVRSWAKMRQHPMLGHPLGQVVILRADARKLPLASADDTTEWCECPSE